jgi:hypothetical protein
MSNSHRGTFKDASYNDMKHGKKHIWKVLYRYCSFRFDPLTNIAATGNSCFRLVDFQKSSSLKLLCQNEPIFGGKIDQSETKIACEDHV